MISSPAPMIIIAVLLFTAVLLPLVNRLRAGLVHPLALAASSVAAVVAVYQITLVGQAGVPVVHELGGWTPPWGIVLRVDYLSAVMALLVNTIGLLVLLFAKEALDHRLRSRAHVYYALYLLFQMGMSGFVMTGDLFNLYVFLEVVALTGYALVAVGDPEAPFAAFRYLILGSLAATLYLVGLAYLYGVTGSLNMQDVARLLVEHHHTRTVFVAMALLLVGFGIKTALFPLHAWLPDAYSYAPNTTTAFMAAVGTKIGAYGIFRVLYTVYDIRTFEPHLPVTEIMGWMAGVAIIVGSLLAIAQTDLKRMLAYSSVSQIGYVLLGFSLANAEGIVGGVLHIINHAFMKASLFLVTAAIVSRLGHRDIRRFGHLGHKMPLTMAAFTVAALSMVGVPPLAGFFSKWYLVLGAVEAGQWVFVAVILVSSLLNAVYFFRIIERAYLVRREDPTPADVHVSDVRPLPASMLAPLGLTALAILLLGLGSWPIAEQLARYVVPAGL